MNPTLLQQSQPSPFDLTDKYLGQGRPFSNSAFSTNDFSFPSRRARNTGMSAVALPTHSSLDFNPNSLLSEAPYHHNAQLLLSPPDSTTGSASTSGNPSTSSNTYTTLPKPFASNAYASDQFSSAHPSILSSNWTDSSMIVMDHPHRMPPLSPPPGPNSYNTASGMPTLFRPFDTHRGYSTTMAPQISPSSYPLGMRFSQSSYPTSRTSGSGHYFQSSAEAQFPGQNMPADNQSCPSRDGPPFNDTRVHHHVLTHSQRLEPEISASIQKGFFQVDRKWICYRRNYFSVQCAFNFRTNLTEQPFYLIKNGSKELIQQFAVSISAKTAVTTNGESEHRGLVQHTPKRDKATESIPGRHTIAPVLNNTLSAHSTYSNGGHGYGTSNHIHSPGMGIYGGYDNTGSPPPNSYIFDRIQFQKATANNGKRRAQQQYFLVVVELAANIGRPGTEDWVVIATKDSDPMVVRGRSPGHYKDNGRRDSQTSMDPDCGTGLGGGGGHSNSLSSTSFGHGQNSMDWSGYSRGHGGHYPGTSYRDVCGTRFSPMSMGSSSSFTDADKEPETGFSETHTAKSSCTLSSGGSALTPLSDDSDDILFSSLDRDTASRKRQFEDDDEMEHLRFPLPEPFTDNAASLKDFPAVPFSKMLCAT